MWGRCGCKATDCCRWRIQRGAMETWKDLGSMGRPDKKATERRMRIAIKTSSASHLAVCAPPATLTYWHLVSFPLKGTVPTNSCRLYETIANFVPSIEKVQRVPIAVGLCLSARSPSPFPSAGVSPALTGTGAFIREESDPTCPEVFPILCDS